MGKHLNLSQRIIIESNLNEGNSLRKIGEIIGKPHTTISREILSSRILIKGNHFNNFNVKCDKNQKAPFVCNGCPNKNKCKKTAIFIMQKMPTMTIVKLWLNLDKVLIVKMTNLEKWITLLKKKLIKDIHFI